MIHEIKSPFARSAHPQRAKSCLQTWNIEIIACIRYAPYTLPGGPHYLPWFILGPDGLYAKDLKRGALALRDFFLLQRNFFKNTVNSRRRTEVQIKWGAKNEGGVIVVLLQ